MVCEICNKKLDLKAKLEKFNLLKCNNCKHIVTNLKTSKNIMKKLIQIST